MSTAASTPSVAPPEAVAPDGRLQGWACGGTRWVVAAVAAGPACAPCARTGPCSSTGSRRARRGGCSPSPSPTARSWPSSCPWSSSSAALGAINPLILRSLIDNGIYKHNETLVIGLAILVAVLALFDAGLALTERRISAYIGESLIYDMRAKVFRHIQRMPLAFFTRTQTGALVSRLNNDVIGAQQAFTDLLSNVVGNLVTVVIVLAAMFFLSWQITLAALILLPHLPRCRPASSGSASDRSPRRATTSTAR